MPSTTVHLPDELLSKIDQLVKEKGISRNRFIVQACERAVNDSAGKWPEGFFESKLSKEDLDLLRDSVSEMETEILRRRRSRRDVAV